MSHSGFKRDLREKFYTKIDISKICISKFIEEVKPRKNSTIIEPSAGNGSFSDLLIDRFKNLISIDVSKEKDYILQTDFLTYKPSRKRIIHTIGNPPFGRGLSMVRRFVKHASTFSKTISFILPKSFRKDSVQRIFPRNFHLCYEWELPKNSFYIAETGVDHDVPCVFQIWKQMTTLRHVKTTQPPLYFTYLKYGDEQIQYAIRRVGGTAGKLCLDPSNCSPSSHYFIRLVDGVDHDEFINKYDDTLFEKNNTVGPRSISKGELNTVTNAMEL